MEEWFLSQEPDFLPYADIIFGPIPLASNLTPLRTSLVFILIPHLASFFILIPHQNLILLWHPVSRACEPFFLSGLCPDLSLSFLSGPCQPILSFGTMSAYPFFRDHVSLSAFLSFGTMSAFRFFGDYVSPSFLLGLS